MQMAEGIGEAPEGEIRAYQITARHSTLLAYKTIYFGTIENGKGLKYNQILAEFTSMAVTEATQLNIDLKTATSVPSSSSNCVVIKLPSYWTFKSKPTCFLNTVNQAACHVYPWLKWIVLFHDLTLSSVTTNAIEIHHLYVPEA
jgi:hypothetical protein